MSNPFAFLDAIGTYEQRKVARYESGPLGIDTCLATDTGFYETAIAHPFYNEGKWVIVEEYTNKELAKAGHDRWVAIMSKPELPDELLDVSSSFFAELLGEAERHHKRSD